MQLSSDPDGNFTINLEPAFSSESFSGRNRHTTRMLSSAAISRSAAIFKHNITYTKQWLIQLENKTFGTKTVHEELQIKFCHCKIFMTASNIKMSAIFPRRKAKKILLVHFSPHCQHHKHTNRCIANITGFLAAFKKNPVITIFYFNGMFTRVARNVAGGPIRL